MAKMTAETKKALEQAALHYDTKLARTEAKRGRVNIYRIAIILKAIDNAATDMKAGSDLRAALCANFNDRLLDVMLKAACS
jgi:hypothetical protein